jgi:hypothetical protein
VGYCGAAGALDRGWEATAAAVDGEQELRRRSGEVESSGKREVSKMGVCKCKSKFTRSSRRRHSHAGAAAGDRRGAWRLGRRRRDVEG